MSRRPLLLFQLLLLALLSSRAAGAEWLELQRQAAYQYCISGYVDEGRRIFGELLARVGLDLPRTPASALAALALGRARVFETLQSSLANGEPELAKAIATISLESSEAGKA